MNTPGYKSILTDKPDITLVFPIYKDENTVIDLTKKCIEILTQYANEFEIVIVDDHSPDSAGDKADTLAELYPERVRVIHHIRNMGYGAALKSGFSNARYEWICQIDGDDQYDIRELPTILHLLTDHDLIIAFRHQYIYSPFRILLSKMYNKLIQSIFRVPFRDIGTGFRIFRRSMLTDIAIKYDSSFAGAELAIRAQKKKYRVVETGINSYPRKFGKGSSLSFINISTTLIDMCRLYIDL